MANAADVEVAWTNIESTLKNIANVLAAEDGPFLSGKEPLYADFILVSVLHCTRQIRPDAFKRLLDTAPEIRRFWEACEPWR